MPQSSYLIKQQDIANGDYSEYKKVFLRNSYITKERGKKLKGFNANSYQTSIVKP